MSSFPSPVEADWEAGASDDVEPLDADPEDLDEDAKTELQREPPTAGARRPRLAEEPPVARDFRLRPEHWGRIDSDPKRWPKTPTALSMLMDQISLDISLVQPLAELPEALVALIVSEVINRGRLTVELTIAFMECGHRSIEEAFMGLHVNAAFRANAKESGCRPIGYFRK